jgi:hypothetical protein
MIVLKNNIVPRKEPKKLRNTSIKRLRVTFMTLAADADKRDKLLKKAKAKTCAELKYLKMQLLSLYKETSIKHIRSFKTFNGVEYKCVITLNNFDDIEHTKTIVEYFGYKIESVDEVNKTLEIVMDGVYRLFSRELVQGERRWSVSGYITIKKSDAELFCKNGVDIQTNPKKNFVDIVILRDGVNPTDILHCEEDEVILETSLSGDAYYLNPSYDSHLEDAIVVRTFQNIGADRFKNL